MPGVYAVIEPDGGLKFRNGDPHTMLKDTDTADTDPVAFTVLRAQGSAQGLCGYIEDGSRASADVRPNAVGQAMVAAFGSPDPPIHGALAICGTHAVPGSTLTSLCGLTEAQQRLICAVHARVRHETGS